MTYFEQAKEIYQSIGVDVEKAIQKLDQIAISLHCWQGDDVQGFENAGALDGGIAVTGNYPGRASCGDELRADLDFALQLLPGEYRLNLHAIYAESTGTPVKRNEVAPEHFSRFIDWAKQRDDFEQSGCGRAGFLDRTRDRLPQSCRNDGKNARQMLHHQLLDAGRIQRYSGKPPCAPSADGGVSG